MSKGSREQVTTGVQCPHRFLKKEINRRFQKIRILIMTV